VSFKDGDVVRERHYELALSAREPGDGITYIDWCPMHEPSRQRYLPYFAKAEAILNTPGTCLYVHCRSGRDRSVLTVFALLRLRYHFSEVDAWNVLQGRLDANGWPCAVLRGRQDVLDWIDQVLAS
jgi:protein-tyrosine phosphatase